MEFVFDFETINGISHYLWPRIVGVQSEFLTRK